MTIELTNGSFGTTIRRTIKDQSGAVVDVSGATGSGGLIRVFYLKPPSGTVKTVVTSFTTDGTDGKVQYQLLSGDIDETGPWQLQVRVITNLITGDHTSVEEDWAQVHERFV